MRFAILLLLILTCPVLTQAQVLKRLGERVKGNVEWRVQREANQKVDDALDSLLAVPKKVSSKSKEKKNKQSTDEGGSPGTVGTKNDDGSGSNSRSGNKSTAGNDAKTANPAAEGEQTTSDGYVKLALSAGKVFTGGSVRISGESVKYKNFNTVELRVTGPSPTDTRKVTLDNDGKFMVDWNASEKTGTYTVTLTSSDKKATQTAKFEVTEIDILFAEDWPEDNTRETKRALANLEQAAELVEDKISTQNRSELQSKLKDAKDKVQTALQLYHDLGKANREMAELLKKSGQRNSPVSLPKNLKNNLSELNNTMAQQARELKQLNDAANHKPQDNTICEYLVMLNEACAAFSTFTNGYTKTISGLIKNIAIDKGVPKTVSVINENGLDIPQPADFPVKEAAKIYATSKFDAESLTTKLGKAGIAGDIIQFATDVLMKIYCEVFSGTFKHDYQIDFRNAVGTTWWKYGVEMQAALTLRAPKSAAGKGDIIKLKGNLEGNATNFTFFENVEEEDEFRKGTKSDIQVYPIKTYIPLKVSFATAERDILGFGAIARGLATPAYFNIPIDAEYDVDNKKIKIFINEALIDFSPLVQNQFLFALIGGDLLPYIKYMTFPIHKARLTINGAMASNHEFEVTTNAKGKASFTGKGSRHIGDAHSVRETVLNFTLDVSKQ